MGGVARLAEGELHAVTGGSALDGGSGNDGMVGTAGGDTLHGHGGHDHLLGGDGADALHGGDGWDEIRGGAGNDTISGGADSDRLFGDTGDDMFLWSPTVGQDTISGGPGRDTLVIEGCSSQGLADAHRLFAMLGIMPDAQDSKLFHLNPAKEYRFVVEGQQIVLSGVERLRFR
jgi:Ca2+-binding RTX toxin-like protein